MVRRVQQKLSNGGKVVGGRLAARFTCYGISNSLKEGKNG